MAQPYLNNMHFNRKYRSEEYVDSWGDRNISYILISDESKFYIWGDIVKERIDYVVYFNTPMGEEGEDVEFSPLNTSKEEFNIEGYAHITNDIINNILGFEVNDKITKYVEDNIQSFTLYKPNFF